MKPLIKRLLAGMAAGSLLLVFCTASASEVLRGDLNGDGVINSADQRLLLQAQGGSAAMADLSGDGLVDDVDADLLWRLTFGSLTAEELEQLREQTASTSTTTAATSATTTTTTTSTGSSESSGSQTPSSTTTAKPSTSKTTTTTTTKKTTTTTKPTTTTTTTTTTTKPTTTTTTEPPVSSTVTAQVRPTLTKVTTAAYTPAVKSSSVKDSAYVLKVKNSSTGTVYDNTTQTNLQKMLAYIVKNEMGTAKFATNSTAAWKAQAVAAYTHLIYSYNNKTYTYGTKDLNLNDSNDKKIYNAVGEVLGVKILSGNAAICAYYSGSAAGTTRNNQTGYELSYIQPVFSPETDDLCSKYGYSGWSQTYTYTLQQIIDTVASKTSRTIYAESESGKYPLYAKSWTGAYVDKTNLYYMSGNSKVYITGRNIREYLGIRSASFVVTGQSGDTMTISVKGHGHGMGLSQVGAVIFANEYSWTYEQILAHYFGITADSSHQLYGMNW